MSSQNGHQKPEGRRSLNFTQDSLNPRGRSREFFTQNKKAEIDFFDRFEEGPGYDVLSEEGYLKIVSLMRKNFPLTRGTIFDMGCGTGAFTNYISKAYPKCKVIGLDISKGSVRKAKNDYPKIKFLAGDVENTGIASNTVDLACYTGIFHHFTDFSKVAKEASRIVKPGGFVFSYDPNFYNPAFWLYRSKKSPFYSPVGVTTNERLLKTKEIVDVFSKYDIVMKPKIVSGIKFTYVESERAKKLLHVYNFFDNILASTIFGSYIGSFILGFGIKITSDDK